MAGDLESARREAAAASRIFEQEARSAAPRRRPGAGCRDRVAGASVGCSGAMAREGPGRRAQHRRHREPPAPALAGDHAVESGGRVRTRQRATSRRRRGSARTQTRRRREDRIPSGGRLVVAQANQVSAIEPVATKIIEESEIGGTVYETLLATDTNGHLLPWLCEKWDLVDHGRRCVLTLRRDVHFSDGTPLTAGGVKSSIETSIRSAATVPAAFAAIRGVPEFRAGQAAGCGGPRRARRSRDGHRAGRAAADLSCAAHRRQHGDRQVQRRRAASRRRD